ncbi:hypothetical protein F66182_1174 [Fusarium sp. NRRL 66182]|nr:hypothetical protein F66182_1174 [Fusarium sp. NRRL 66182]
MGRTEPSIGQPPAAFRKDARSKKAKATINKVIPSLLPGNHRARHGIDMAQLVPNPKVIKSNKTEEKLIAAQAQLAGLSVDDQVKKSEDENKVHDQAKPVAHKGPQLPRISLRVADTLTAARALLTLDTPSGPKVDLGNNRARVAILNMGSPLSPGGGFLNGANSQEESLCMRTTLYPSLKDEWYRLPDLAAIYTPDVLVFRDEEANDLDKKDRFYVDCITAAMLRSPESDVDPDGIATYANNKDRDMAQAKMKMVMRICSAKGVKRIVLGAWGCGAHGNPIGEVARCWKAVLRPKHDNSAKVKERWESIDEVVFAIKDPNMADVFETAFGQGLERVHEDEEGDEEEQDEEEAVKRQELLDKIQELEKRIQRASNPRIKDGLTSILEGLRNQLPEASGTSGEPGEESE